MLELEARYGVSALRDVIQVQNGGSVTNTLNRPEYVFATTGPGSVATMKTAERYMPGSRARWVSAATGPNARGRPGSTVWVFDDTNGFLFEILAE
jgi:hypothetical protein